MATRGRSAKATPAKKTTQGPKKTPSEAAQTVPKQKPRTEAEESFWQTSLTVGSRILRVLIAAHEAYQAGKWLFDLAGKLVVQFQARAEEVNTPHTNVESSLGAIAVQRQLLALAEVHVFLLMALELRSKEFELANQKGLIEEGQDEAWSKWLSLSASERPIASVEEAKVLVDYMYLQIMLAKRGVGKRAFRL